MSVTLSWLEFDTSAALVDVRVSWLEFDTHASIDPGGQSESSQVYGGKKRRGPVDDLTVEQVRKHWEVLEEKAAREAPAPPAPKAATPTPAPATVATAAPAVPLPASIKITNPKGQIVSAQDLAAMAQDLARQRVELNVVMTRARRAADDALIFALLGD